MSGPNDRQKASLSPPDSSAAENHRRVSLPSQGNGDEAGGRRRRVKTLPIGSENDVQESPPSPPPTPVAPQREGRGGASGIRRSVDPRRVAVKKKSPDRVSILLAALGASAPAGGSRKAAGSTSPPPLAESPTTNPGMAPMMRSPASPDPAAPENNEETARAEEHERPPPPPDAVKSAHPTEEELSREDLEEVAAPPPVPEETPRVASSGNGSRPETLPFVPVPPMPPDEITAAGPGSADTAKVPPIPQTEVNRPRKWFDWVFEEDFAATTPYVTMPRTLREVAFLEDVLCLTNESRILDLGCGNGRHAIELAANGRQVTGYDLSERMLDLVRKSASDRGVELTLVQGDLRDLNYRDAFDAVYCLDATFGYFDDDENRSVIEAVSEALSKGGRFVLEAVNRDYVIRELPDRVWWEGNGCIVLEEVEFDFISSRIFNKRSVVSDSGKHVEQEMSMRAYSLHELGRLLHNAGFRVIEISGHVAHRGRFFGNQSTTQILVAEKR